jgi:tetratricopeptide (TPR) repeat protein
LALVLAAEVVAGGVVAARRIGPPVAPVPDLSFVDPLTADELRSQAAACETADQWGRLGESYVATGYFPEGEACLRRATALAPTDATLRFKHAFALERIGRLEEATVEYEAAAGSARRRAADCWYYIGRNHLRAEQEGPAAEALGRAGDLPAARYQGALLAARAGRSAEAEAEAARLATEFPAAQEPVSLLYRLAVARNDRPTAARLADRFARQPERLPTPFAEEHRWVYSVYYQLGRNRLTRDAGAAMQAGRYAEAEKKLREAQAASWDPDTADQLAEALFRLGRPAEAAAIQAEAVERNGPAFGLLWRLGESYAAAHREDDSRAAWERADALATGTWAREMWAGLADRYARRGDTDRATAYRARSALATGMEAVKAGRPGPAVGPLTAAVKLDPRLAHGWYYLGEAARAEGRTADARAAYQRCLQIDPDHGRAIRALELVSAP